jgi:hypothetical protein
VVSETLENLSGNSPTLANETKQNVLGTDVVVAELDGFTQGKLKHLFRPRREWQ